MIPMLLALLAASMYGTGDFLGGLAGRRAPLFAVTAGALAAGLMTLLVLVPFVSPALPPRNDILWGALGGVLGAVAVTMLYASLANGRMSVVAPVCGVCAIVVPVLLGVVLGERPSGLAWIGVGMALLSVILLGQAEESSPGEAREAGLRPVVYAVVAGVTVGLFLALLKQTSREAGVWPLVASRVVSLALVGAVAMVRRQPLRSARPTIRLVIGSGVIDTLANVAYLFAVRAGSLSIVATLASLYPAATILCARVVLGEHITRVQMVGLLVALAAAGMIGLG